MSYSKFTKDLNRYYTRHSAQGIDLDTALAAVCDEWLAQGCIEELLTFTIENRDSGNVDNFIGPIEAELIAKKDKSRFNKPWRTMIRYRLKTSGMNVHKFHPVRFDDSVKENLNFNFIEQ